MLSEPARIRLNGLVFDFLGLAPDVARIEVLLGPDQAAHLPFAGPPFRIAVWLVDRVLLDREPVRFCRLVERVDPAGTQAELHNLVDALRNGRLGWGERQRDTLVVLDDRPFVDRDGIREVIAAMFTPTTEIGCLIVSSDPGEGKSYLLALCTKLTAATTNGRLATFQVDGSMAASLHPGMVATTLASDLCVPIRRRPRIHEDHERWAEDLAHWIVRHIAGADLIRVLVFDGLGHPQIPQPVHTLVRALVRARQDDPAVASRLRIVFLGYDGARLERHGLRAEQRVLEYVDKEMVRIWLERRYPGRAPYEYEDTAALVCEMIPASGPARMRALCTELRAVGPELAGGDG